MAKKKTVTFKRLNGDAVIPDRDGVSETFNLRASLPLTLKPGDELMVKFGISCDRPIHIYEARGVKARGLTLVDGIWAATDRDVELSIILKNSSNEEQLIERTDVLARFFVVDNSDYQIEVA